MEKKTIKAPLDVKEGTPGKFKAVFSTFNVIDLDGDVTLPGAFKEGEEVRISYWSHRWHDLPVGKGVIYSDDKKAWVEGEFFLDTEAGRETYMTVKNLGGLQEYSYGYDVLDSATGQFKDKQVRFLKSLKVFEVSPVFLGAGIGTQTLEIKGAKLSSKDSGYTPEVVSVLAKSRAGSMLEY